MIKMQKKKCIFQWPVREEKYAQGLNKNRKITEPNTYFIR